VRYCSISQSIASWTFLFCLTNLFIGPEASLRQQPAALLRGAGPRPNHQRPALLCCRPGPVLVLLSALLFSCSGPVIGPVIFLFFSCYQSAGFVTEAFVFARDFREATSKIAGNTRYYQGFLFTLARPISYPRDGYDRDTGKGEGHLFKIGPDGKLLGQ
jgi:hypothetical protein